MVYSSSRRTAQDSKASLEYFRLLISSFLISFLSCFLLLRLFSSLLNPSYLPSPEPPPAAAFSPETPVAAGILQKHCPGSDQDHHAGKSINNTYTGLECFLRTQGSGIFCSPEKLRFLYRALRLIAVHISFGSLAIHGILGLTAVNVSLRELAIYSILGLTAVNESLRSLGIHNILTLTAVHDISRCLIIGSLLISLHKAAHISVRLCSRLTANVEP
ncbi:MAG: hypothetical protein Q4F51_09655 [Sarcina sp.]|nr:hypothetical protein [Sarcina sp.]